MSDLMTFESKPMIFVNFFFLCKENIFASSYLVVLGNMTADFFYFSKICFHSHLFVCKFAHNLPSFVFRNLLKRCSTVKEGNRSGPQQGIDLVIGYTLQVPL